MLNFPDAPTVGQGFTAGSSWSWDGVKWVAVGTVSVITVTATTILPAGTQGDVLIQNGTSGPISVTMPPTPVLGQALTLKDSSGNAGAYPITILVGNVPLTSSTGAPLLSSDGRPIVTSAGFIDGSLSYMIAYDYMSVELFWMGSQWGTR